MRADVLTNALAASLLVAAMLAACGRARSWRVTPAAARPAAPLAIGPAPGPCDASSTLTEAAIKCVVDSHLEHLRLACHAPVSPAFGRNDARVVLHLEITANGTVDDVRAYGDDRTVAVCVQKWAKTWVFPSSDAGARPVVPLFFDG